MKIPSEAIQDYNRKKNELFDLIKSIYNGNIEFDSKTLLSPYVLNIYIPEKKFAIDLNNNYYNSEFLLDSIPARHKHLDKTILCEKYDVRLFHIFEGYWDENKEKISNFLKSCLGINNENIFARKCEIVEDIGKNLINTSHLQGYSKNILKTFDLLYEGECVGSLAASRHHRQTGKKTSIVLSRMVFKPGCTISGGASKLFNYFKEWSKLNDYQDIISWSDNSWTQGNIYKVLDFKLIKNYPPDYFYWNVNKNEYTSKQSQKKSENGCPNDITEREWCKKLGLYRIYDCGKKLWSYNLKENNDGN